MNNQPNGYLKKNGWMVTPLRQRGYQNRHYSIVDETQLS